MTATLAPRNAPLSRRIAQPTLKSHLAFTLLGGAALLALYTLLRIALLVYNR